MQVRQSARNQRGFEWSVLLGLNLDLQDRSSVVIAPLRDPVVFRQIVGRKSKPREPTRIGHRIVAPHFNTNQTSTPPNGLPSTTLASTVGLQRTQMGS